MANFIQIGRRLINIDLVENIWIGDLSYSGRPETRNVVLSFSPTYTITLFGEDAEFFISYLYHKMPVYVAKDYEE